MSSTRRRRVFLLFGGQSAEHDVSRVSAVAVARALDPARYEVVPVGIAKTGEWLLAEGAQKALAAGGAALPAAFEVEGPRLGSSALMPLPDDVGDLDVVFPLLHGPFGEDGTVQGLLEMAGLPYVGSGVLGSAVGMDKGMMKRAFISAGLATPDFVSLRDGELTASDLDAAAERLGYPCFVKPANLGSSVGVSRASGRKGLGEAVDLALTYDEWVIIEEGIDGREIEVAVLGDFPPEASIPGEIVPGAEFYTFEDKYLDGRAELRAPADLPPGRADEVRRLAVDAFKACRCEGMARVDFFFEDPGRGFLVNEVNTIPGFTPISMYPRLWELSGLAYPQLLDRLIDLAVERHQRRARRRARG